MAKYSGHIGFSSTEEIRPGVFLPQEIEKPYRGDTVKNSRYLESQDKVNDDLRVGITISIIADAYAYQNFHSIRYATYMGSKWKVNSVEVVYPRLKLTLGGLYNESNG